MSAVVRRWLRRLAVTLALLLALCAAAIWAWREGWILTGPSSEEVQRERALLVAGMAERLDVPPRRADEALTEFLRRTMQRQVRAGTLSQDQADELIEAMLEGELEQARAVALEVAASNLLDGELPAPPDEAESRVELRRFLAQTAQSLNRPRRSVLSALHQTVNQDLGDSGFGDGLIGLLPEPRSP